MSLPNNIFRILCAAALCAAVNSASLSIIDSHVIGGAVVSIEQFPYQVSLSLLGHSACGASILGPKHIISAAHCFIAGSSFIEFEVRAGSTYKNKLGKLLTIDSFIRHPNYVSGKLDWDVAVAQLDEAIQFEPTIQPIALVPKNEEPQPDDLVTASGWGRTGASSVIGADNTNILHAVTVPIVSRLNCRDPRKNYITQNMICAGSRGKSVFKGDSGGPLVNAKKQLVGLVSFTSGLQPLELPAVYCNIASPEIHDFITANADIAGNYSSTL